MGTTLIPPRINPPADDCSRADAGTPRPAVLQRMRRPAAQEKTLERIRRWREACPDLTLRSTLIVGFPGETDEDFGQLLNWLDEAALDRVGRFRYEPVRGAAANDFGEPVPDAVKEERWHGFMQRQHAISARRLKRKVGARQQVIVDVAGLPAARAAAKAMPRKSTSDEPPPATRRRDCHRQDRPP